MATRRFSADNSEIRYNLPAACDFTGAFTLGVLVRRRAASGSAWHALLSHHDTSASPCAAVATEWKGTSPNQHSLATYVDTSNNATEDGTTRDGVTAVTSLTDWYLAIVTKAAGTTTPRVHLKNVTTGAAWVHENAGGTLGNPYTCSGGTIRLGEYRDVDDANVNLALDFGFDYALSDLQVEALATNLRTSDAATAAGGAPKYLHELNQAAVGDPIPDLMGNGATVNVVNGTTVETGNDPPGWTFDGTGGGGGTIYQKTGTGTAGTTATAADVFTASETATAATAARAFGADVFEATETGTAATVTLVAGPSDKTAGGTTYAKTGTAAAGTTTTGPRAVEAARTGTATSAANATGADVAEHARTGIGVTATKAAGGKALEAPRFGVATVGTIARGSAQAGFVSKLGTATTGSLIKGADVFEATETGTITTASLVVGDAALTVARTGLAPAGTEGSGTATKVSPVTYVKTGTATARSVATGADVFEASRAATATTATLAAGLGTGAPAIPRWDPTPSSRWPATTNTRWDVEPSDRWDPAL